MIDVRVLLGALEWLNRKAHESWKEYMLCIVLIGKHVHTPHEAEGTKVKVERDCDVRNHHYEGYKGSIHIHLPDGDGYYSYGFSYEDFHDSLKDDDQLAMVVSGKQIYALYGTSDTRKYEAVSDKEWEESRIDDYFMYEDGSKDDRYYQEAFTRKMCSRLGYVLYEGSREEGLLRKVYVP